MCLLNLKNNMYEEYVYIDVSLNGSLHLKEKLIMKFDSAGEGMPCVDCGRFCRQQCMATLTQVQRELSSALSDFVYEQDTPAVRAEIQRISSQVLTKFQSRL